MSLISLDTNAYTGLLNGSQAVNEIISSATQIYLSVVVIAELLVGFKGGSRENSNRQQLDKFLALPAIKIVHANLNTADIYSYIKCDLKKNGTPIPTNDIWIAAHAMETGSVLVTLDKHFDYVNGLRVWKS